ncbi:4-hydroxythreonine-4-phosphate dehydrogenase PdxA [Bacteroidota bacterium]
MIGITMGDANGVGPEIILKAFKENHIRGKTIVIGDYRILDYCNNRLNINVSLRDIADPNDFIPGCVNVLNLNILDESDLTIGKISKKVGHAALQYIHKTVKLVLKKELDAMVTLPINKEAIGLSKPGFQGHTDFIAELCNVQDYTMMLASDRLIVTHASMHVSLGDALQKVNKERVFKVIQLTNEVLKKLRSDSRIAVAGLNPHAGEGGVFGEEDIQEILPAVQLAKQKGINASGPVPPDTVFYQAVNGKFDAVVCMYHDQGHIPMKLIDFEGAVNVTLGLPITRTSVDHGTAYDIAYTGVASITSFCNAYKMAGAIISQ